jgi:FkbM family methyltransferase
VLRSSPRWAISAALAPHPRIHRLAQKMYNIPSRVLAEWRPSERQLLEDIAREKTNVFFVQIGANDGKTEDYLYEFVRRYHWKGILVEPVKSVYESLLRNYHGTPGLIFENVAIADAEGSRIFYRLRDDPSLPPIASMIGSFDRNVLLRKNYIVPNFESYIVEEPVACCTFESLAARHQVEKIDVIVIDVEGYDYNVLRQIDFARHRPDLVIYEETNLSTHDKRATVALLKAAGYAVRRVGIGWNNAAIRNRY